MQFNALKSTAFSPAAHSVLSERIRRGAALDM